MQFFKRFARPAPDSLPKEIRQMLQQLHQQYQSVGLLPHMSQAGFIAAVQARMDASELEDLLESWQDGEPDFPRTFLFGRAFGVHSDWRFDPADILLKANRCLAQDQLELAQEILERTTVQRDGRPWQVKTARLSLVRGPAVTWRYTLLPGLFTGINHLLKAAHAPGAFTGLATDGDYFLYIYVTPQVVEQIEQSGLFQIHEETDPTVGFA